MKFLILILLVAPLAACNLIGPKPKLYRIDPVTTVEDVAKCAKAGGHAVMIADIDTDGSLASEWISGCALEVK